MTEKPSLKQALATAGATLSPEDADAILEGILGAPEDVREGDAWLELFADDASVELTAALRDRLDELSLARASGPAPGSKARLESLRRAMKSHGVTAYFVPRGDRYQGEYVPASANRLAHATGFTGSAGMAIIKLEGGAVFTDGRYTIQVRQQVDERELEPIVVGEVKVADWVQENLGEGDVLGFDPWLMTRSRLEDFEKKLAHTGATLAPIDTNLVDATWEDRPAEPLAPVSAHPIEFVGVTSLEKRRVILEKMSAERLGAALFTSTEATAWLLNLRGGDVPFTPMPLGYSLLVNTDEEAGKVHLFMDPRKLTSATRRALEADGVVILPEAEIVPVLTALESTLDSPLRVHCDVASASIKLLDALEASGKEAILAQDLTALPRARKNEVEREGARRAHVRDGLAITRFLAWLDESVGALELTEIKVSDKLEAFRQQGEHFRGLSFPSISGFGPNGAIIHYRATPESDRAFGADTLYLIDSGGQYADGTTDITRTVAIGDASAEMKRCFTLVLKGMIQLSLARFPRGTVGTQLDLLARQALWQHGLNFNHGTGHGVGSYLSVHEGPQSISPRINKTALEPGMILSNEPGYYKEDAFGIRIENLIMVTEAEAIEGGEVEMLGFETLTLAPIDQRLILTELMTEQEIDWLDAYHQRVREAHAPNLDASAMAWLEVATAPLKR